jgi:hypothetical protein
VFADRLIFQLDRDTRQQIVDRNRHNRSTLMIMKPQATITDHTPARRERPVTTYKVIV